MFSPKFLPRSFHKAARPQRLLPTLSSLRVSSLRLHTFNSSITSLFSASQRIAYSTEPEEDATERPRHWDIKETDYGTIDVTMNSNAVNCINWEFFKDLHNTVELIKKEYPPHKPVVLRSANKKVFSAGLDLPYVTTLNTQDDALDFIDALNRCFTKLYLMKRPTIAVLDDKHAIAGGLIMALCADFQIVNTSNSNALYGLKEMALGLPFPSQVYYIIEKEISDRSLFREMALTGYWVPAEEGVRRGLFSHGVKSSDEVEDKIREIVSRIDMEKSRDAYLQLKRMMKSNPFRSWLESDPDTIQAHDVEFVKCLLKDSTKQLMLDAVGRKPEKEQTENAEQQ